MRINTRDHKRSAEHIGEGTLQAIRFDFHTKAPIYPLKISSLNPGRTDILLYVAAKHRVTAPSLKTLCVLDHWRYILPGREYLRDDETGEMPDIWLTKLSGSFKPEDMTDDLVLRQAASDDVIPRGFVSPPFLENLGALLLACLGLLILPPISFFTLVIIGVVEWRRFRRPSPRFWVIGALIACFEWIPFVLILEDLDYYWPAGVVGLTLATVVAARWGLRLRASKKPLLEQEVEN
jgi:hypothetical protein